MKTKPKADSFRKNVQKERMVGDSYMLPPSLLKKVKVEAKRLGINKSEFIRQRLKDGLLSKKKDVLRVAAKGRITSVKGMPDEF